MIEVEQLSANALQLTLPHKVQGADFAAIAPTVDAAIGRHGQIRIIVNASEFNGWDDLTALEAHVAFVRPRIKHIERLALIAGHEWQRGLIGLVSAFVHPEVRAFDRQQLPEAQRWITE